jgi:integrase/recombinase XerD
MVTADKVLSDSQLAKLLKKMKSERDKSILVIQNSRKSKPQEVRTILDFFLFSLIANTGLRISEALNLMWEDVHEDFLIIRPEISKNRKKGMVYYGPKTRALLDEFYALKRERLNRTNSSLLFSMSGKVPSRSYAHMRFKFWLCQSGISTEYSIHSLRHTYGTMCLDHGLSLTFVRDQLRHSNISITSQYLHLTRANREKVKDLF